MVTFHCMFCGVKYQTPGLTACDICGQTVASGWLVKVPLDQACLVPAPVSTQRRGRHSLRLLRMPGRGRWRDHAHVRKGFSPRPGDRQSLPRVA